MGRVSKRRVTVSLEKKNALKNQPFMHKIYRAGIYTRLSSDQDKPDGKKISKSESAEGQIEIAKSFVEGWNQNHQNKIEVVDCYTDLGKTGANFNRAGFERLMQDVRIGDINCIIVKDLSRFGRNYLEAGNYIEKIFPFLGVRFIAVTEGFDTGVEGNEKKQITSEIKNLVNDLYAKDFSRKAQHSLAQRREEGSYVGGPAPYGYVAVWEGKIRKLKPDENTAEIIRFIYEQFATLESYTAVADELNKRKVNPPAVYRKTGEVHCPSDIPYKGWDKGAVERILKSETYMGKLIQGKTSITARDERNRIHRGKEEWVRRENTHEPLVEKALFNRTTEICRKLSERTKAQNHPTEGCPLEENIFDTVLFCGICGRKMTRHSQVKHYADGEKSRMDSYFCLNAKSTKVDSCTSSNRISKIELEKLLVSLLEVELAAGLGKQKNDLEKAKKIIRQKAKEAEKRLHLSIQVKERLTGEESEQYMAYRAGKISQKEYVAYNLQKEKRLREMEKQEQQYKEQIAELERNGERYLKAVRALLKLKKGKVLTKELIEALISKIYLYPGKRIEVLFSYTDAFLEGGLAR